MVQIIPEGGITAGEDVGKLVLTKEEHDQMVEAIANGKQATADMAKELADLRKKNRDLSAQNPVQAEDISKAVESELKKRDADNLKTVVEQTLAEFLDSHPEFSKETDTGGLKFAAYQKALARINLTGVKTKEDYSKVLEDALRLTEDNSANPMIIPSAPRGMAVVPGSKTPVHLTPQEQKLVVSNFGGDVEKFLKVKAKRPEYMEEILKYVRA